MPSWLSRLPLSIRAAAPAPLRRAVRVARHMFTSGQPSVGIPPELLSECRMCASRNELVANLPKQARVAEVGTYRGEFARHILTACDPAELHLIDIDVSLLDPVIASNSRVTIHQGASQDMLARFPDNHFDWIYIDGDHSYAGASGDARVAAAKVKPGGHLVFNDFAHADPYLGAYGVHRAVTEFAVTRRWPFAWWAYEPHGLYDVALRRPIKD
jgi:methyltransferase family protein